MPTSKRLNVAVVGATGMVGNEMLRILAERKFPAEKVRAYASERSIGMKVAFNGDMLVLERLDESSLKGSDVVMFAAGADISLMHGPIAAEAGALVIDKSSAWRMKENVPLVVPEVNPDDIKENEGIIASPNCTTIPLTMVLEPIRRNVGVERVIVSTYQAASGAGRVLSNELAEQTKAIADNRRPEVQATTHQLAYNVIPGGWQAQSYGYNEEELKLVNETRKILHDPELKIVATCVRVPVQIGHSESVIIETTEAVEPDDVRTLLGQAPGIVIEDDPMARIYPTPLHVAGHDDVYVGRIRKDLSSKNGIALWIVSDNLRKGAALNAVQIAEQAIELGALGAVKA